MPPSLLPKDQLGDYLLGGMRWSATVSTLTERLAALGHYRRLAGLGYDHVPFFFVVDLSVLLDRGPETPFASDARHGSGMAGWSDDERALRLRYENQLLGRLLLEPALQDAREILATHRDTAGPTGEPYVGRLRRMMALLLRQLAPLLPRDVRLNPAHLRGVLLPDADPQTAAERFPQPELFAQQLVALADAAQQLRWSRLLLEEDLFELAHHDTLKTEAERIGCRQLIEVARQLGEIDPRQVSIADEGQAETAFVDETHYPAGGLTGLTNRGALENLVLSELVYIDRSLAVDMFDLRMMEGELLYYLRDDGVLRRKRRVVHIVLDADERLRRKPMGYDVQLSVLLAGLVLRLAADLRTVFSRDALQLHIHYHHPPGAGAHWEAELDLLRLLLADAADKDLVAFSSGPAEPPAALHTRLSEPRRKAYLLSLTAHRASAWQAAAEAGLHASPPTYGVPVSVGDPELSGEDALVLPADGAPYTALSALKDQIVCALAGLRR